MHSSMNADEGDLGRVDSLQVLTMANGDEPVFGAMNDISVAIYVAYPFVGTQMIPQYIANWQYGKKAFHYFPEVVVGGVENEVAGLVVRGYFAGEAATNAAAVHDDMVFGVIFGKGLVDKLHISQHFLFAAPARAFAEAAIVDHNHIVIVPVEIPGIFGPSFNTTGIAMKIKNESLGFIAVEMKSVDAYAGGYVEEQFMKGHIEAEFEIGW